MTREAEVPRITGLATVIGNVDLRAYAQAQGPKSSLPITCWFPAWWGISSWATQRWMTCVVRDADGS
jgi:hypothetical protein